MMTTVGHLQAAARAAPPAFAALDLGTNNCRLLVGAPSSAGFRVLDSFSRVVRLGEGLQQSGRLSPQAMDRAIDALQACADRLRTRRISGVRAIATEACRRAANTREFVQRVANQTGLHLDVISTREEATLALESCAPLLDGTGRRALLFDIGGGSTELVWVRLGHGAPPALIGTLSLPIGVVGLAERHGPAGFTPAGFRAMVEEVANQLVAFERVHCIRQELHAGGVGMVGTSGTVTTLAGQALRLERYRRMHVDGQALKRRDAQEAVSALLGMGRERLAAHPCVGPDRADYVLPGCAIYTAIHSLWPVDHVMVADRGLREGMLMRLIRDAKRPPARSCPSVRT